ncbi:MAG: PilZ domain-containing protein [Phycisphaerae bacterium]|nr:PilZ domain-containing protein [Phycisphaerae bacterium]
MTGYSYELGEKQSSRVLEQAVRVHSPVWAEAIDHTHLQSASGKMLKAEETVVYLKVNSETPEMDHAMPGQYYQLVISLDDQRYLTVSDLVEVQTSTEGPVMVFSRPRSIQVLQRRRYVRSVPSQSYPVYLRSETEDRNQDKPVLGQIRDISVSGMSIRLPGDADSNLFIGDVVQLRFSLSVREPEFVTRAAICHKQMDTEKAELVTGVEFVPESQDPNFQSRLRGMLLQDGTGLKRQS